MAHYPLDLIDTVTPDTGLDVGAGKINAGLAVLNNPSLPHAVVSSDLLLTDAHEGHLLICEDVSPAPTITLPDSMAGFHDPALLTGLVLGGSVVIQADTGVSLNGVTDGSTQTNAAFGGFTLLWHDGGWYVFGAVDDVA